MANEVSVKIDLETKQALNELGKLISGFNGIGTSLQRVLVPAGVLVAAVGSIKKGLDLVIQGENLKAIDVQFKSLASSAGIASEALISGLEKAADGLVGTSDLMRVANKGIIELGTNAQRLPEIFEIARKATAVFGGDVLDRFEDINRAIATGNTRALKQIGLTIDQDKAFREFAKTVGVSAGALSEAGRQQAILNAIVDKAAISQKNIDVNLRANTDNFKRLKVAVEDIGEAIAIIIEGRVGKALADGVKNLADWAKALASAISGPQLNTVKGLDNRIQELTLTLANLRLEADRVAIFAPGETQLVELRIKKVRAELEQLMKRRSEFAASEKALAEDATKRPSLIDPAKAELERLAFEKEVISLREARINEEISSAEDVERRLDLFAERRALIEEQTQAKIDDIRAKFFETRVINQEQFNFIEEQLVRSKNAKILALEKQQADSLNTINKMVRASITPGLTSAFSALGAALAKGENAFDAFGKAILGALGSLAIQIGSTFLGIGLGLTAAGSSGLFPAWVKSGAETILAGLGLITLGGALQAAGTGGGGGGAAAVGGDGAGGGIVAQTPTELTQPEEIERRGPSVTVNIQGNVLDRRQTGLEIAEVIQETFGSNAMVFTT